MSNWGKSEHISYTIYICIYNINIVYPPNVVIKCAHLSDLTFAVWGARVCLATGASPRAGPVYNCRPKVGNTKCKLPTASSISNAWHSAASLNYSCSFALSVWLIAQNNLRIITSREHFEVKFKKLITIVNEGPASVIV